ncbi:MAG TPA: alpha/beta hydrolase [Spongiibacteraceae bacterium]|jgi:acetyl esterase/lipase
MYDKSNIHPDFRKIPQTGIPFDSRRLAWINSILKLLNAFKRRTFAGSVTKQKIVGLDGNKIPVTFIKPAGLPPHSPALVYCHGGAFVLSYAPQHIENSIRYAQEANCCVIFVDYRLAPRHHFPRGFDDCYAALLWAFNNADVLGIDKQRIAVGGDSAGGALAASIAQKAAHENGIALCAQLLIYPVTDMDCKTSSSTVYADTQPFKAISLRAMWNAYLGGAPGNATYASPIHGNLSALASAYIETAEFDPLHDEGIAYANALTANGVAVVLNETKGTVHGYDLLAANSEFSRNLVAQRIHYLRKIFAV